MHVLIAFIYGGTIWLAVLAYALITNGPSGYIALAGPLIISGGMLLIWALDYAVCKLHTPCSKSEQSDARP